MTFACARVSDFSPHSFLQLNDIESMTSQLLWLMKL